MNLCRYRYYSPKLEFVVNKEKNQTDKNVLTQEFLYETALCKKKIRNTFFMMNIKYKTKEVGTSPEQKTKLNKFLAKMK